METSTCEKIAATLQKKILVIFDFDHTIIDYDTYHLLRELLGEEKEEAEKVLKNDTFINFNRFLFAKLKEKRLEIEAIKKFFLNTIELTNKMKAIFEYLREKKEIYFPIIISGSIKIIIEWVIEHFGFADVVKNIYSRQTGVDDQNYICYLENEGKKCSECNYFFCKSYVLNDILKKEEYVRKVYVGDGLNDLCPAKILSDEDILCPRKGFPLFEKIIRKEEKLNCKIFSWENGEHILEALGYY
jgi:pyridoxal phosphate phosphatase PHOSPHO2